MIAWLKPNYLTLLAALAATALLASAGLGKYKGPLNPQALRKKAVNTKAIRARIGGGL
jgi:hypothetical protein